MIPVCCRRLVLFTLMVFGLHCAIAQHIYVNTSEMVFELISDNGQSRLEKIPILCDLTAGRAIYSIAIYRDTLYYNSGKNLFRVVPGIPGSCERVTVLPGIGSTYNCMAADKYGRIFTIEFNSKTLYMYDPSANRLDSLGILPSAPAGDLMFYKGRLMYATIRDGIFEIDLDEPSRSKQYMPTPGYSFFGLLSFPYDCNSNKVYGISLQGSGTSTDLIELDLERKIVLSKFNSLPYGLYDAASSVDNGNTIGVSIDSVEVKTERCTFNKGTDMHFLAFTAAEGPVTFAMDGATFNEHGRFENMVPGRHTLKLKNVKGCVYDTIFTVTPAKDPRPDISIITEARGCANNGGSVTLDIKGAENPYEINFNGEGFKPVYSYHHLNAGNYPVIIRTKNNCTWDTVSLVPDACEAFFMPNAFTPNGDGNNDFIRPVFSSSMGDLVFIAFNRFGQKVFESVGQTKGWDGRIGGSPQPSGSYAYMIKYKKASGEPVLKKGTFMLLR